MDKVVPVHYLAQCLATLSQLYQCSRLASSGIDSSRLTKFIILVNDGTELWTQVHSFQSPFSDLLIILSLFSIKKTLCDLFSPSKYYSSFLHLQFHLLYSSCDISDWLLTFLRSHIIWTSDGSSILFPNPKQMPRQSCTSFQAVYMTPKFFHGT